MAFGPEILVASAWVHFLCPAQGWKGAVMAEEANLEEQGTSEEGAQPHGETTDWKAEARKWEKRAKENSDAAKKLADIEEQGKSELQKAQEAQRKAESELEALKAQAELEKAKAKIAADTGVPANLLRGTDEESLREHAKAILEAYKPKTAPESKKAGSFARNAEDPDAAKRELAKMMFANN